MKATCFLTLFVLLCGVAVVRGFWLDTTCSEPNCAKCYSYGCYECYIGYYKYYAYAGASADCVRDCPVGYTKDYRYRTCRKCGVKGCTRCYSLSARDKCFGCEPGRFVFEQKSCVYKCPAGYVGKPLAGEMYCSEIPTTTTSTTTVKTTIPTTKPMTSPPAVTSSGKAVTSAEENTTISAAETTTEIKLAIKVGDHVTSGPANTTNNDTTHA
ncbi:uncharacterized protein LOC106153791 [Lingula anatina]|uniref:Uncharacterized protein LOC106153791 n=1 Tax=Lingula anatina TaxID=7574 RepID=A0A1S3HBC5_LINAN|nr:uncharacterized protein LOC106153791 [Lingula anatina]|eukprot:XP_013383342.1 uncharacterized protein LOC106153791 [Lingula anatina]